MTTGLERIAAKAREDRKLKFTSLAHHLTTELLWESVSHIPKRSAPGCDGQTVEEAQQSFKQWAPEFIRAIHEQGYRPPPIRRVFIPKPGKSEKRPLGVPCVTDRAMQRSVAGVLGAIYEQEFLPCSFGGRPKRGAHQALATLGEILSGVPAISYVLEADLKNYFGSLDHGWLLRFLEERVADPRIVSLVRRWLKAGILEEGELKENDKGTPQGGSISPLASNILLTPFDREMRRRGYQLTRYADDGCITCTSAAEARAALTAASRILEQLGVQLNPDKTRIVHVRRGLRFLGFIIKRGSTPMRLPPSKIKTTSAGALYAFPQNASVRRFKEKVRALTRRTLPGPTEALIPRLYGELQLVRLRDLIPS